MHQYLDRPFGPDHGLHGLAGRAVLDLDQLPKRPVRLGHPGHADRDAASQGLEHHLLAASHQQRRVEQGRAERRPCFQ